MHFLFHLIFGDVSGIPSNPLVNVLSNPIWQSLGILISVFLSIILYRKQRSRKEIVCDLIYDATVLSAADEVRKRVKFLLDNKPVEDLCVVLLNIWNSGNAAVKPSDFRRPLRIDFGGADVLEAGILDTTYSDIKEEAEASLKVNAKDLTFEPLLLNSKDSIKLKVLLTGHTSNTVHVDTHIIEGNLQTRTSVLDTSKKRRKFWIWAVIIFIGGQVSGFEVQWKLFPLLHSNPNPTIISLVFFLSLFLKNLSPSVLVSSRWIKRYSTTFRTMRAVIISWVIFSAINSLPLALILLLFTRF